MPEARPVANLEDLLDRLNALAEENDQVALHDVLHALGRRSFGPWLLVIGLVTISPVGDIPTVPTMMAAIVFLISVQLLLRRPHFWLPPWLLNRSTSSGKLTKTTGWVRKPARWIDKILRPRLEFATGHAGTYAIAALCVLIALGMPPMEFVPFTGTVAGSALAAFGIALIANDGLVAMLAIAFTVAAYAFLIYKLL